MSLDATGVRAAPVAPTTDPAPDYTTFFRLTYEQTLGLTMMATGNWARAEDATQEAYARALKRWDHVGRMAHPERWVARVAMNCVVDIIRRVARESPLAPDVEAPPGDEVQRLWLKWGLDGLSPMQRAAITRRYINGMSVDDVATSLGRSTDTVKSHIRLGRARLRAALGIDR